MRFQHFASSIVLRQALRCDTLRFVFYIGGSMRIDQLRPNVIVRGPIFPEPVQIIVATAIGESIKIVGKGLNSGKVHEPILNAAQLSQLEATPEKEPFDGDPQKFRIGIEALRLALAFEYD